jgi:hypothetical protein
MVTQIKFWYVYVPIPVIYEYLKIKGIPKPWIALITAPLTQGLVGGKPLPNLTLGCQIYMLASI